MPEPLRFLSPCPARGGHVLLRGDPCVLHRDHLPPWLVELARDLDEDCGWAGVDGRPLLEAALAGDDHAGSLLGSEISWRVRCRTTTAVA